MRIDANEFLVGTRPEELEITVHGAALVLSHERAEVLAQTILAALKQWKDE